MTIVQQEVAEAPILLNNPTFIADSLTEKNSIVVVSNSVDSKYRPIAIILKSDGTAMQIVDSNFLTSMYGKEETEFTDWIDNFIQANKVLYVNKNKSQELESRLRVSFPSSFSSLSFVSIIHPSVNAVNGISDKNKT